MTLKIIQYLKYSLYTFLILVLLLLIGGGVFSYFYKDKIIAYFIEKANERLIVPVDIKKIDISIFKNFPATSIVLEGISINSPANFKSQKLAEIPRAYLTLNPFKVIRGKYEIDECIIEGGRVNLEIDSDNNTNYLIVKKREKEGPPVGTSIKLVASNVAVNYLDHRSDKDLGFVFKKVKSTISILGRKYKTNIDGNVLVTHITLGELTYFSEKEIEIDAFLNIDDEMKFLTIEKGNLKIGTGDFILTGDVSYNTPLKIDLVVKGVNTNAQTLLSLLPDEYSKPLLGYKSKGEMYFEGSIKGEFSDQYYPNTILKFGAKGAAFYHPDYKKSIDNIFVTGELITGTKKDFSLSMLHLSELKFDLDGNTITGLLDIKNFKDPWINSKLKGKINLNALIQSFPNTDFENAFGELNIDIHFSGYPNSGSGLKTFKADGEVELYNVSFIIKGERLPFNTFNGSFMFRENDLAISNLSGSIGKSDFTVNGFFKNITSFFRKENNKIKIEADLTANYLDFDELLMSNFASRDTINSSGFTYSFNISPDIDLNFNCDVKKLRLRRFHASNISGNLRVINSIANLNNLQLNTMGGELQLEAAVDNRLNTAVEITSDAELNGIYVDSIFYVFHNFDQSWLIDKNLKGQLNADVNTYVLLDNHLQFYSNDFYANISASIKNGELLNFEPMQKLSRFVEEKSLAHLKFSEVRNDIVIRNKTIYIPRMLVSSSISNIQISGTHTFDQHIDYHVAVPLKSFLRIRKLSEQEMQQSTDGSQLLLRIYGTTSDYEIKYDTKEVKRKMTEDIREEGKELKEIFKNKGKTEEDIILVEEDDYFDFEEDQ